MPPVKQRVSKRVRVAVEQMVMYGLERAEAAKVAGLTDHSLYCALRKPHVLAALRELMEVKRTSAAARTIARAENLADRAESEHVRLQANEWLGGLDGVAPVARSETTLVHTGIVPGLTIIMAHRDPAALPVIDGEAREITHDPQFPVPVPHPALMASVSSAKPVKKDQEGSGE